MKRIIGMHNVSLPAPPWIPVVQTEIETEPEAVSTRASKEDLQAFATAFQFLVHAFRLAKTRYSQATGLGEVFYKLILAHHRTITYEQLEACAQVLGLSWDEMSRIKTADDISKEQEGRIRRQVHERGLINQKYKKHNKD